MLDIEMASAACPTCKIVLVEASSASTADLGTAVNEAVTLGASVVSNSYGGAEDDTNSSSDASYYHHPGVAIFASAGDQGYGAEYPAAGQWVIGVGGTTLKQETNTRGWAERAWADGGSGCSAFTPKPSWQTDSACSFKIVSDLAAVADPNTGVAVYDNYGSGGWAVYGGTSVASPLVASIFAAVGLAKVDASAIWGHTTEYRDVTKGSNGTCSTALFCTAGAGYDGPTGWGTPVASKLLKLAATL
jgi:subtilase family serine protease